MSFALPEIRFLGLSLWDTFWSRCEHISPCWDLYHVFRGKVVLRIAGQSFAAKEHDTLIVPVGVLHRDQFDESAGLEALLVGFLWPRASEFFSAETNRALMSLSFANKNVIRDYCLRLYDSFRGPSTIFTELNQANLYALLLCVKNLIDPNTTASDNALPARRSAQILRQAKEYIRDNLARPLTLRLIANYCGISPYHLSHCFSTEGYLSFTDYLTDLRLQCAARLLNAGTLRVSEVAYKVGYGNANYFSKVFRKRFGRSPSEYRLLP